MKPGNLSIYRCDVVLNPAATEDEDSITAHRIFGVRFFVERMDAEWKKDCLLQNA